MGFLNEDTFNGKKVVTSSFQDTDGKPTTRVQIGATNFVVPVDIQGVSVGTGESFPVKNLDNAIVTQYETGKVLATGASTLFNHTVKGKAFAVAIRWGANTDFTVEVAYVVPNTDNTILVDYATVMTGTAVSNKGVQVDALSKTARFRVRNSGTASATITSITVVDFL
jgi:hypothetical protein